MRDQRASDFVVGADADDWMDDGRDVFDDDDEPFQEDAKTKKQKKKMAKFASGSGNIAAMILKQAKNSKTKTKGTVIYYYMNQYQFFKQQKTSKCMMMTIWTRL